MNWKNLQTQECPDCGDPLDDVNEHGVLVCNCGFAIREERMEEIVDEMD